MHPPRRLALSPTRELVRLTVLTPCQARAERSVLKEQRSNEQLLQFDKQDCSCVAAQLNSTAPLLHCRKPIERPRQSSAMATSRSTVATRALVIIHGVLQDTALQLAGSVTSRLRETGAGIKQAALGASEARRRRFRVVSV